MKPDDMTVRHCIAKSLTGIETCPQNFSCWLWGDNGECLFKTGWVRLIKLMKTVSYGGKELTKEGVMTGKVKWWSEEKGYGFIVPDDGTRDVFVHYTSIVGEDKLLREGDKVKFQVTQKAEANDVEVIFDEFDDEKGECEYGR